MKFEDEYIFYGLVGFVFLVMITSIVYIIADEVSERRCLEAGYPVSYSTYRFETYCAAIDGTQMVKLNDS